ncbi:MAG: hypothetical protein IJC71_02920, partial [Clostridia bacterium]|nr:hypothetical protein [Clostridia bacterium]
MFTNTVKIADKKQTRMVAHRGVSGLETENTAVAFVAAGNRTYYGIETDIYHTADGEIVCQHDSKTGRICEVDLVIEQSNFEDLRALQFKDKDGATDRAEIRIATFYEYMKICKKYEKHAVPELKSNYTLEEMRKIMKIVEDLDYCDHTTFIAFNIANLDLVKEVRPEQDCQFLTSKWSDELPEMLEKRSMNLDIYFNALTKEALQACHDHGVEVNCWTVDDPEKANEL